jgi:hypothetical protein
MSNTPAMHVLLHPEDIALLREDPKFAAIVKRYDDGIDNLSIYYEQIEQARVGTDDDFEIDDNPMVSVGGDPGVWVSAWVWVPMPEEEEEEGDEP